MAVKTDNKCDTIPKHIGIAAHKFLARIKALPPRPIAAYFANNKESAQVNQFSNADVNRYAAPSSDLHYEFYAVNEKSVA